MTDTIDAFPEDVLQAAREAYISVPTTPSDKWFLKSVRLGDYDHQMPIRAAASAILAERKRRAKIADDLYGTYDGTSFDDGSGSCRFNAACRDIARHTRRRLHGSRSHGSRHREDDRECRMTRPLEMAAHDERTYHQDRAEFWLGYLLGGISITALVMVDVLGSKLWG